MTRLLRIAILQDGLLQVERASICFQLVQLIPRWIRGKDLYLVRAWEKLAEMGWVADESLWVLPPCPCAFENNCALTRTVAPQAADRGWC